jgi:hypothetical protein
MPWAVQELVVTREAAEAQRRNVLTCDGARSTAGGGVFTKNLENESDERADGR